MPKQELQDEELNPPRGEQKKALVEVPGKPDLLHYFPYDCLGEQVVVKRIDSETELTPGGVVKPEIARLKSNRGIIMALGEGRIVGNEFQPLNLQVGQVVRFARVGGTDIEVDGEPFILLHWKQIYLKER